MSVSIVATMVKRIRKALRGSIPRAVGVLLVLLIFYGTTIEAAHRHSQLATATDATARSLTSPETSTLKVAKANCNDCLICQLHQNFSATLITVRGTAPTKPLGAKFFTAVEKDVLSQVTSPGSGRAPPLTF